MDHIDDRKAFPAFLLVDKKSNLDFFLAGLLEVAPPIGVVTEDEIGYVASVLADRAMTSTFEPAGRRHSELHNLFDRFVLKQEAIGNFPLLETASAENLLLTGFFRNQLRRRHDMEYFEEIGRSLYFQASEMAVSRRKKDLYSRMCERYRIWARTCLRLHLYFRDQPYKLIPQ